MANPQGRGFIWIFNDAFKALEGIFLGYMGHVVRSRLMKDMMMYDKRHCL